MPNTDLTSDDRYAIGLKYKMDMHLTRIIPKDGTNKAIALEKVFNDYLKVSYVDAGAFRVDLKDKRFDRTLSYPIRSDFGNELGTRVDDFTDAVSVETGTRTVAVRGRSNDVEVHIINESNIDARIANVSQHGTVVQS